MQLFLVGAEQQSGQDQHKNRLHDGQPAAHVDVRVAGAQTTPLWA